MPASVTTPSRSIHNHLSRWPCYSCLMETNKGHTCTVSEALCQLQVLLPRFARPDGPVSDGQRTSTTCVVPVEGGRPHASLGDNACAIHIQVALPVTRKGCGLVHQHPQVLVSQRQPRLEVSKLGLLDGITVKHESSASVSSATLTLKPYPDPLHSILPSMDSSLTSL